MTWALGISATQSAGLREMFGTMCKPFHPGRAAQNGLASALLASKNFTSSERGLEAPRGFAHVLSGERDFSAITQGLGESFEITRNTYKPFACGIVIHPVIDACIRLRGEHQLVADQIERVEVRVHPLVLELTGKKSPSTGLEGKFSVYHSSAVAILRGAAGQKEYTDATVQDPEVIALRDRVTATTEKNIRADEAYVTIILKDGRKLTEHIEHGHRKPGTSHDGRRPGGQVPWSGRGSLDVQTDGGSHRPLLVCRHVEGSGRDHSSLCHYLDHQRPLLVLKPRPGSGQHYRADDASRFRR